MFWAVLGVMDAGEALATPKVTIRTMFSGGRLENPQIVWEKGGWAPRVPVAKHWDHLSCATRVLLIYPFRALTRLSDGLSPHLKVKLDGEWRWNIDVSNGIGAIFQEAYFRPSSSGLVSRFSAPPGDSVEEIQLVVDNGGFSMYFSELGPRMIALKFASGLRVGMDMSFSVWGQPRYSSMGWMSHSSPYIRLFEN